MCFDGAPCTAGETTVRRHTGRHSGRRSGGDKWPAVAAAAPSARVAPRAQHTVLGQRTTHGLRCSHTVRQRGGGVPALTCPESMRGTSSPSPARTQTTLSCRSRSTESWSPSRAPPAPSRALHCGCRGCAWLHTPHALSINESSHSHAMYLPLPPLMANTRAMTVTRYRVEPPNPLCGRSCVLPYTTRGPDRSQPYSFSLLRSKRGSDRVVCSSAD
jgi:hypothetical protein